jgi:glycerophosphoryl diester phosphodiesterase
MFRKTLLTCILSVALLNLLHGQSLREKIQTEDLIICSHRGVTHPNQIENSITSMEISLESRILLHEIDLMESSDGELFLLHDETLDRTTDLTGRISEKHSDELADAKLRGIDENLPRFGDVLDWAKENEAYLMLDVKQAPVKKVMDEVQSADMMDRVMILTFNRERAQEAFDYEGDFLVSVLITSEEDIDFYQNMARNKDYLLAYINKTADDSLFEKVNEAGIPIVTDTMGELDDRANEEGLKVYQDFIHYKKPDILVTDYPLLLQQVVE